MKDVAGLPVPDFEQRRAIEAALHNARAFLEPATSDQYRAQLAALDTLPKRRVTQLHQEFHVKVYIRALERASISDWALCEAVGDFLTGTAGQTYAPSPPELIAQANVYMGKALWKMQVYKTWLDQPAWLRPPKTVERSIDDEMIDPAEVDEANDLMRRFRLQTRFSPEGGAYMLLPNIEQSDACELRGEA